MTGKIGKSAILIPGFVKVYSLHTRQDKFTAAYIACNKLIVMAFQCRNFAKFDYGKLYKTAATILSTLAMSIFPVNLA